MTKLEELIYSLATVLVRYHDSQPKVNKLVAPVEPTVLRKKSREHAIGIIQNKETKYDLHLKGLIDACTKGYPDRKHFLIYILHEINFLKEQLDRKTSFTPSELEEYQNQITQLFLDFRQLLNTSKEKMHKVKYSALNSEKDICIDLSGLINNAWVGNAYCNSGTMLIEEVLNRFHITTADSDEEIREVAVSLCMENQNALLVSVLQGQKLELESHKFEFGAQKAQLESQRSELLEANQIQQKTIVELRSELEVSQTKLQSVQSEFEDFKVQKQKESEQALVKPKPPNVYNPLFGLSGLNMLNQTRTLGPTPRFFQPQLTSIVPTRVEKEDEIEFESSTAKKLGEEHSFYGF